MRTPSRGSLGSTAEAPTGKERISIRERHRAIAFFRFFIAKVPFKKIRD
jgi:hypothetical protein